MGTLFVWFTLLVISSEVFAQKFSYPSSCAKPGTLSGPSPPLPVLPDTFQTKVEVNIINKRTTEIAEEFVDGYGNRVAVRALRNNTMGHVLFDYTNGQSIYVNVTGGNCLVEDLDLDPNQVLFGATNGSKGHLHLLSSAATLHFAKANGLTYIGQKIVRGIETDHWQSCMYWDILSSNFTLDYYFSVHNWSESASFRQVPVRAEVQGFNSKGRFNLQSPGQPYSFHHIYEYFDFRTELWEDESVFETPKNMVCPGRKMAKKLPGLPNQFSYSLETIIAMQNYIQYSEVWYDYVNRFIKYDYHPQGENHVTVVHDFSTGLSYEMDRVNGSCKIGAIQNSFDVHNGSVPEMKSPPQMFFVDNSTSAVYYTGKYKIRDIQVDGFISKTHDYKIPGYGDFESTVMLYFMSDSWTTSLNYDTAATTIPIRIDLTTPQAIGLNTTQSMYNFKQGPMPINTFDVSSCFPSTSRKSFMIQYNADNTDVPQQFLEAAVTTILSITNISSIRLQNLEVQKDRDHLYVLGTLLATPQTLGALPNPGPQMSLENAWLRLGKAIAEGVFKTQVVINGKATTFLAKDLIDNGNFAERHPGLHMVG